MRNISTSSGAHEQQQKKQKERQKTLLQQRQQQGLQRPAMFLQSEVSSSTSSKQKMVLGSGSARDRSPRMPMLRETLTTTSLISTPSAGIPPRPVDPSEPSTSSTSTLARLPPISPSGRPSRGFELPAAPTSPFLGPTGSPMPSPQWRLPAAGTGGGRAMPKSALLMSKCQAFLKQPTVIHAQPSASTSSMSEKAQSSTSNAAPAIPSSSSSIAQTVEFQAQKREDADASECIFNFEDILFEPDIDHGEDDATEVLRWREVRELVVERRTRSRKEIGGENGEKIEDKHEAAKTVKSEDVEEKTNKVEADENKDEEAEDGPETSNTASSPPLETLPASEEQKEFDQNASQQEDQIGNEAKEDTPENLTTAEISSNFELKAAATSTNKEADVKLPIKSRAACLLRIIEATKSNEEKIKSQEIGAEEVQPVENCKQKPEINEEGVEANQQVEVIEEIVKSVENEQNLEGRREEEAKIEESMEALEEASNSAELEDNEAELKEIEGSHEIRVETTANAVKEDAATEIGMKHQNEKKAEAVQQITQKEADMEEANKDEAVMEEATHLINEAKSCLEKKEEDGLKPSDEVEIKEDEAKQQEAVPFQTISEQSTERLEEDDRNQKETTKQPPQVQSEPVKQPPQLQQPHGRRSKRRAGAAPPPLPAFEPSMEKPSTSALTSPNSPAPSPSLASASSAALLPSCSSLTSRAFGPGSPAACCSSAASRMVERLRIGSFQLRNVHCSRPGAQLAVAIRLDGREVFRTAAVYISGNSCTIGEEFSLEEVPRHFQQLQLNLLELLEGARQQRVLGRVKLSRRELLDQAEALQVRWLPLARVRPSTEFSEFLGAICAQIVWDPNSKMLSLSVLDLTAWTLAGGRENPLEKHSREGGRLHLKLCVAFGRSAFTAMQKMRLSERRGLETVRFDCSNFFPPSASPFPTPSEKPAHSPRADCEWLSGISACSSPACTPSWAPTPKGHSRHGSRQFHFPPPSPGALASGNWSSSRQTPASARMTALPVDEPRVHIKLYGQPNGGQDSYCGSVRIPLDPERMQPRDAAVQGPNWFNIRSRTTTTFTTISSLQQHSGKSDSIINSSSSSKRHNTTTASTLNTQQLSSSQHAPHHQKRFSQPPPSSPSLFRHCSTPSTSSVKAPTTSGAPSRTHVPNTRSSQPFKTPSISSLFSSSGGGGGIGTGGRNNGPAVLQSKKINQQQQQQQEIQGFHQRHSLGNSDLINMGVQQQHHHQQQQQSAENLGEIRLKFWYNMDEVLPLVNYQPLYMNLTRSLTFTPYSHSLISLIQCLPIDIENMAKPLMKIFIHSNQIRHFFRLICAEYVSSCSDVNTLFRSQSLASKVMYEMMKFVGHKYLVASLKPLIDLIYAERKSCEIDPSKLKPGESLEQNFRNITVYAELAFSRVVDSRHRCPQALRELFAELRAVVEQYFPGRVDVARLACSSFLIMRFFAAAILNPKLFALKLETPDMDVSRTLVLVSKILQRLANCVVSAHPLTTKEQWLAPVLQRFSDDAHKMAMINFLDEVSTPSNNNNPIGSRSAECLLPVNNNNDENALPPTPNSIGEPCVLKSGYLIERRFGPVKKRSFKNFIHPKRRLVVLTESMLNWQKTNSKESAASSMASALNAAAAENNNHQYFTFGTSMTAEQQQKSQIPLAEVTSCSAIMDAKNSFRVATKNTEVHFQAGSEADMNEWIILIQKQQRRLLMHLNRPTPDYTHQMSTVQQAAAEVDIERELHAVYTQLGDHMDTLCKYGWCCRQECPSCGGQHGRPMNE